MLRAPSNNGWQSRLLGESLAQEIQHYVQQRTRGRVNRVKVELRDGRVVVTGHSQSYYGKQLALQAILDVLGPSQQIELNVDVCERPLGRSDLPDLPEPGTAARHVPAAS